MALLKRFRFSAGEVLQLAFLLLPLLSEGLKLGHVDLDALDSVLLR